MTTYVKPSSQISYLEHAILLASLDPPPFEIEMKAGTVVVASAEVGYDRDQRSSRSFLQVDTLLQ